MNATRRLHYCPQPEEINVFSGEPNNSEVLVRHFEVPPRRGRWIVVGRVRHVGELGRQGGVALEHDIGQTGEKLAFTLLRRLLLLELLLVLLLLHGCEVHVWGLCRRV